MRNVGGFDSSDTRDEDRGAAGREPMHVGTHISWIRPPAPAERSHSSLVNLESVHPSFLEMGLSPPSSSLCGCYGENKCCAFPELSLDLAASGID